MYYELDDCKIIKNVIELNQNKANDFLKNSIILITGGAGSIGVVLCKRLLNLRVKKIIVYDINELSIYNMMEEFLEAITDGILEVKLGNILDMSRLQVVFQYYKPNIVIHTAAYKHVSIADHNPTEVIKCNVLGTLNMLNVSALYDVQNFIYLSSDKAINPSSIMGATKRICEIMVKSYRAKVNKYYSITRFGNVFNSSGSVSKIFKEQIIKNKIVRITHPAMERYFLSLEDAASLIISTIMLYKEGAMFICDMKSPIRIVDLAKNIISAFGYDEKEINIQYTGIREGESLYEELCYPSENIKKSSIKNVLICETVIDNEFNIEKIYNLMQHLYSNDLIKYIQDIVPGYETKKLI